jgi:chitin synthase
MVEASAKHWDNHSSFKAGAADRSGFPSFTVSHYNGAITYSAEGFLDRSLDAINPDFASLLRGAADGLEGTGSINPFAKAIATQAHPRNGDTIVSAQQAVKPMRAPSTREKNTVNDSGDVEEQDREEDPPTATLTGGTSPCISQSWYIFCVNPNDSQLPNISLRAGV